MPDIRRFNLTVQTPDGDMPPAQIEVSDEPLRLSEIVPLVHDLAGKVIGLALDRVRREGKRISCAAGCCACCYQLVPLSAAEVFYLVEKLMSLPVDERKIFLERFDANEKRLASAKLLAVIGALGNTSDNNAAALDYFKLGLSCPFLENQTCSIHAWRPIACREYNVTSPAQCCADPFHLKIETVRLHRRMSEALSRLCSQMADLPPGMVPLPLLFDYFETYKDASQQTWPGIELFDRTLGFVFGKKN